MQTFAFSFSLTGFYRILQPSGKAIVYRFSFLFFCKKTNSSIFFLECAPWKAKKAKPVQSPNSFSDRNLIGIPVRVLEKVLKNSMPFAKLWPEKLKTLLIINFYDFSDWNFSDGFQILQDLQQEFHSEKQPASHKVCCLPSINYRFRKNNLFLFLDENADPWTQKEFSLSPEQWQWASSAQQQQQPRKWRS